MYVMRYSNNAGITHGHTYYILAIWIHILWLKVEQMTVLILPMVFRFVHLHRTYI